jgi:hypothetical protein
MEPRLSSREHIPSHIDLFGGPKYETGTEELELVLKIEENAHDATIILISDVWLDQSKVFDKLRVLFEGKNLRFFSAWQLLTFYSNLSRIFSICDSPSICLYWKLSVCTLSKHWSRGQSI